MFAYQGAVTVASLSPVIMDKIPLEFENVHIGLNHHHPLPFKNQLLDVMYIFIFFTQIKQLLANISEENPRVLIETK